MKAAALTLALAIPVGAQVPHLAELHTTTPPTRFLSDMELGDVDGDGWPDLLLLDSEFPPLSLHLNRGGAFRDKPGPMPDLQGNVPFKIAFFDLDLDGDLDLFAARNQTGASGLPHQLLLNSGTGTFAVAAPGSVPLLEDWPRDLEIGDFNGDSWPDVVTASESPANRVYFNTGTGALTNIHHSFVGLAGRAVQAEVTDLDLDGDLDIVLSPWFNESKLHWNDGFGQFTEGATLPAPVLRHGDLDGDGDDDLVSPNRIFLNDGAGGLTQGNRISTGSMIYTEDDFALADVDGDGDLDIARREASTSTIEYLLLENDGAAGFASITLLANSRCRGPIWLDDIDADGDVDYLAAHTDRPLILRGDGSTRFTADPDFQIVPLARPQVLALGDVDGDGFPDLYATAGSAQTLQVNDGSGRFGSALTSVSTLDPSASPSDAALADLDGDGWQDVYVGNFGETDHVYLNSGTGNIDGGSSLVAASPLNTRSIALGDLDADGDTDVLAVGGLGVSFLENGGTATFTLRTGSGLPMQSTPDVQVGDLDGDGDLDVLTGGQPSRVRLNDGTGQFTPGPSPWLFDRSSVLGDIDDDGDLDFVAIRPGPQPTPFMGSVGINQGAATFTITDILNGPTRILDAALLDLDGDGVLELVCSGFGEDVIMEYVAGNFVRSATKQFHSRFSERLTAVDIDLDGDDDLVEVQVAFARVHFNTYRQLAWETPPRLGATLELGLNGAAFNPWLLAYDFAGASAPLAPFGTLRLPPNSLRIAGFGQMDARGHATFEIPIPHPAWLAGIDVYWQALIGTPPAGLSNLEITTLSAF